MSFPLVIISFVVAFTVLVTAGLIAIQPEMECATEEKVAAIITTSYAQKVGMRVHVMLESGKQHVVTTGTHVTIGDTVCTTWREANADPQLKENRKLLPGARPL